MHFDCELRLLNSRSIIPPIDVLIFIFRDHTPLEQDYQTMKVVVVVVVAVVEEVVMEEELGCLLSPKLHPCLIQVVCLQVGHVVPACKVEVDDARGRAG